MSRIAQVGLPVCRLLAVCAWVVTPAFAQDYPQRPVSIVLSTAAGSSPDVIARVLADSLSRLWKHQVLVINRPGGSGLIAARAAASAPADGYSLFMALASAFVVLPESKTKLPVDLDVDFAAIGLVADQPMMFAVSSRLGVGTLPDLIALAKSRPNEILFGASRLSVPHMTGELLNRRAGIKLGYVPTQGGAKVAQDVMNGSLQVYVDSVPAVAGALQDGALKPLAVASERRLDNFPDVPLVSETLPGFQAKGWYALMAQASTPPPVLSKLRADLQVALNDPDLTRRLLDLGTFARPFSIGQTTAYIRAERELWRPIVRDIGVE